MAVVTLGPAKAHFHYCRSCRLLKVYFQCDLWFWTRRQHLAHVQKFKRTDVCFKQGRYHAWSVLRKRIVTDLSFRIGVCDNKNLGQTRENFSFFLIFLIRRVSSLREQRNRRRRRILRFAMLNWMKVHRRQQISASVAGLNKALFTRHKLTRIRPGLKLTRVSFCRVNTANSGSTRVSLSCKHY